MRMGRIRGRLLLKKGDDPVVNDLCKVVVVVYEKALALLFLWDRTLEAPKRIGDRDRSRELFIFRNSLRWNIKKERFINHLELQPSNKEKAEPTETARVKAGHCWCQSLRLLWLWQPCP
ncbi:hypothetical protein J6590_049234 [Homalodisca vitripennis]|nr:hypothetical protein J6590_049234 [Homalodisca vitripennis]